MIHPFQKYLILLLLNALSFQINAQEISWCLDYQISYYPKITSIKINIDDFSGCAETGEFHETLNRLANRTFGKGKRLQRMPGMEMQKGMAPKVLFSAEKLITIGIKSDGEISDIGIYKGSSICEDDESNLFANLLKTAKVNPALANDKKVNCILYYLLIEDKE